MYCKIKINEIHSNEAICFNENVRYKIKSLYLVYLERCQCRFARQGQRYVSERDNRCNLTPPHLRPKSGQYCTQAVIIIVNGFKFEY